MPVINSICHNHFKNQFETNKSSAAYNPSLRRSLSKHLFNTPNSSSISGAKLEKYGYLSSENSKLSDENATGFGGLKFIFNKNKFSNRTTFTVGDSLFCSSLIASRVLTPKIESLPTYFHSQKIGLELCDLIDADKEYNPWNFCEKLSSLGRYIEYIELQYHGNLTINDVECAVFDDKLLKNLFVTITNVKTKTTETIPLSEYLTSLFENNGVETIFSD